MAYDVDPTAPTLPPPAPTRGPVTDPGSLAACLTLGAIALGPEPGAVFGRPALFAAAREIAPDLEFRDEDLDAELRAMLARGVFAARGADYGFGEADPEPA